MARSPKPWYRKDRKSWFVTIDGRRHNLGPNRKLAFQSFHEMMARPQKREVPSESMAATIDLFLDWALRHRAKRTYEWYLQRTQWFLATVGDLTIGQLKPYHVQQWIDAHPSWSDTHRRGCIIAVQRPLRWAVKMGYIDSNPLEHIEKPQAGRRDEIVTEDEFNAIMELVRDDPFRELLTTAWETGCRPQELFRVEARHVDLEHGRWVFPKEEAKGKKRIRIVYLPEKSLAITRRLMLKSPEGPIFRNTRGTPWCAYSTGCRFLRLQKQLGRRYCLYLLRHSFATRLLERGVDALTVSVLLGHSDTTMLGKVYQHLSHNPAHLKEQLNRA